MPEPEPTPALTTYTTDVLARAYAASVALLMEEVLTELAVLLVLLVLLVPEAEVVFVAAWTAGWAVEDAERRPTTKPSPTRMARITGMKRRFIDLYPVREV
jgi:hypothetical protein